MRRASFTSQTATNWTSFCSRKQPRSYVPRLPMPMPPTTIRSLGATAPSRPKAELGMIIGASTAAEPADTADFKNCRREAGTTCFDMERLLRCGPLLRPAFSEMPGVCRRGGGMLAALGEHVLIPTMTSMLAQSCKHATQLRWKGRSPASRKMPGFDSTTTGTPRSPCGTRG